MRAFASLLPLCLIACTNRSPNPIEAADACIYAQVPRGQMVSADRAREVVDHCARQLDAWSRYSIEGSFRRPLGSNDRDMTAAYLKHRAANHDYWLTHLSDQSKPSFQKL